MTFREALGKRLVDSGLFEPQAAAVLVAFEADDTERLLDRDTEGYPDQIMALLWLGVQRRVVEWIDANQPKHWARAVFADDGKALAARNTYQQKYEKEVAEDFDTLPKLDFGATTTDRKQP